MNDKQLELARACAGEDVTPTGRLLRIQFRQRNSAHVSECPVCQQRRADDEAWLVDMLTRIAAKARDTFFEDTPSPRARSVLRQYANVVNEAVAGAGMATHFQREHCDG